MKFVDLFAGLGGFHVALSQLGHECVFACEIDETLRDLYCQNFGLQALGDIREIHPSTIPSHDILCAGFPCQPFSKAGDQQGLKCPRWTKLLELATEPRRGISHPFVLLEDEFRRSVNHDLLSLVLDRHRLSRPGAVSKAKWISNKLSKQLNA
jgi:DNA (cytosine-5)-methyltransferase 1